MLKERLPTKGFSLVEVLLVVSLFALLVMAFSGTVIYGRESAAVAGARARAVMLAEEGLEATRNIRDAEFSNLVSGSYGLALAGNQWVFSGASDVTDIFTRSVVISTPSTNRRQTVSTVTWPQTPSRMGSVALTTYHTNWRAAVSGGVGVSACAPVCEALGYSAGTCRQNSVQCGQNGETYTAGGNSACTTGNPGDASRDTCCCAP